jgi:hypothetical protein
MMMVMMMATECQIVTLKQRRHGGNVLMVMVGMGLRLLCSAAHGRKPTGTTLVVFLLELPPLPATCHLHRLSGHLQMATIQIVTAMQPRRSIGELNACRDRARERADSGPYTGEHAAKLALDARLGSWARELRLGPLYSLRQRGDAALAVDLLDPKQVVPLVAMGRPRFLDASVSRWFVNGGPHIPIRHRRRGNGSFLSGALGGLLRVGPVYVRHVGALPVRRFVILRVHRPGGRKAVLVLRVRRRVVAIV